MALVLGTNCGFVTVAPTTDPSPGTPDLVIDDRAIAIKIITTDAITISEIGWWCITATQEANFEVGIYSHDGGTDGADTRLFVSNTNAKGTGTGWKVVSGLSWDLDASTTYWLAVQCDNVSTTTFMGRQFISGQRIDRDDSALNLPVDWDHDVFLNNNVAGVYALIAAPSVTNPKVKVSGTFSTKTIKTKIGGTFTEKPLMVKVGGAFQ